MAVILGAGAYRYEVDRRLGEAAAGQEFNADVAAVGVDKQDRVYAFNRGEHPMVVFDRDGNFLRSWGEGVFRRAHGVHMAPDDTIWLTDDGDHTVRQCTLDGKVLLTIGIPGKPGALHERRAVPPLHAHRAVAAGRPLRLRRLRQRARPQVLAGRQAAAAPGASPAPIPASSTSPHNICCDADGWVYVADRENHRVQVFDGNGKYETQWNNMHRPSRPVHGARRQSRGSTSARSAPAWRSTATCPISARGSASTRTKGELLARLGQRPCRASSPASSSRRTASPSTRAATSTSARSPSRTGAIATRASRSRPGLRSLQKLVKQR